MKWISASIRPHRLDDVRQALAAVGVTGLTVTEIIGYGSQSGRTEIYRGTSIYRDDDARCMIEASVPDDLAEQVAEAICNIARTGKPGDGQVIMRTLNETIRIRTGEQGESAL
jgi:nitrogen regulatory protein PII